MQSHLIFSEEVRAATLSGKPVVALESTIISHGMPYPHNVQTALEVEHIIREKGAVPATMICAQLAGIQVFVTGGIGGVHRGAEHSFDISADLQELARTSVAVVCAGAKSILDIGLTLEYLETYGVPVVSVGQSAFPAFFTRDSGFQADFQLDSAEEQAEFVHAKWGLGLDGGVVIANPVPESDAMPKEEIDQITLQALQEAGVQGIQGKAVTPFLLSRIKELTAGRSLTTNIALVKNNARVGAELALALHKKH